MKKISLPSLAILLLLILQPRVQAHAFLDHADPKVGSTITQSPAGVKLWFTQNLEAAFSKIEVEDAQGKPADKKDTHLAPADKALLVVSLPPLKPGTYTVIWHVVSVDTHKTQGHFQFTLQ